MGMSVPATEHSVMTSWPDERAAIENMIERFGTGVFAIVMDSYDYSAALEQVLPSVATKKVQKVSSAPACPREFSLLITSHPPDPHASLRSFPRSLLLILLLRAATWFCVPTAATQLRRC